MKKIFISFILLCSVAFSKAQLHSVVSPTTSLSYSSSVSPNSITLGYCLDTMKTSFGAGASASLKAGIQLPKSVMSKYIGKTITKLKIGIGVGTTTLAKVYLAYSKNEAPFYTQDVTFTASSWNEITLTTPYVIEGKELFISYSVTAGTSSYYPIGVDAGPANALGNWFYYKTLSGTETGWVHLNDLGAYDFNMSIKAVVEGSGFASTDLGVNSLTLSSKTIAPGTPFNASGSISNFGTDTIKSFNLEYTVGNQTPIIKSYTNVSIPNNKSFNYSITDLTTQSNGYFPVRLRVLSPNGTDDAETTDNSLTKSIIAYTNTVPKKVLLEHFTTAQCTYCPAAHLRWKQILAKRSNVIWVAHHTGYLTDGFTISESTNYLWFYGGSTFAPASMLDRSTMSEAGVYAANKLTPVFSPVDTTTMINLLSIRQKTGAIVDCNIAKNYNPATRLLNVTVSGSTVDAIQTLGETARLNVYLTEDSLIAYQAGGGGSNYQHDHVIRDAFTPVWGDSITFNNGTYSKSYSMTLPSTWTPRRMKIVAFVSEYDATSIKNCGVYNAQSTDVLNTQTAIESTSEENVSLYTFGKEIHLLGEFDKATVYNLIGNSMAELTIDNPTVKVSQAGVYLVKVTKGSRTYTVKTVVK